MAGPTFTLLVVCLCLVVPLYAQSFSLSYSNITSVGQSQDITLTLSGFNVSEGSVSITLSFTPAGVINCDAPVLIFTADQTLSTSLTGLGVGTASVSFSASLEDYSVPSSEDVFVFLNAQMDGDKSLYPGKTVHGAVSLDASPSRMVIATLTSDPAVTLSPSSFTFMAGQAPYSQPYTLTSITPGNYTILLTLSGYDIDHGYVSSSSSNVTLEVDLRLVYGRVPSASYLSLATGEVSGNILFYVDVKPENGLGIAVFSSDPSLVATPASPTLNSGIMSATFTVIGNAEGSYYLTFSLSGMDESKYTLDISSMLVTVSNRTIHVPSSAPSLVVGTSSDPLTAYITLPDTLRVTPSGPNLTFSPDTIQFTPQNLVAAFTVTATGDVGSAIISYSVSGVNSAWYSLPSVSTVNVVASLRQITPSFSSSLDNFPVGILVGASLSLDYPTPTSFTVLLTGDNLVISPSSFTFQNSVGTLQQSFVVNATALGFTRIFFTISGIDSALVDPVAALAITVVPRQSLALTFPQEIFAGAVTSGSITLPVPISSGLTIALSAIPSNSATFSPPTITLHPLATLADFTMTSNFAGPLRIHVDTSGADSQFYTSVSDVDVDSIPIHISVISTFDRLVVGVTYEVIVVSLDQPTTLPVTVTPYSDLLKFNPATIVFAGTSVACLSFTPNTATSQSSVITFTVDDTTNFLPPDPLAFPSIDKRAITIDTSIAFEDSLVVGIPSSQISATLSAAPNATLTLTPTSPTLAFNPPTLVFSQTAPSLSFSVTATSVTQGSISWELSGDEADLYNTPEQTFGIVVSTRSLIVPYSIDAAVIGTPSKPFLVTTDYAPSASLTITPIAQGLTFSPPFTRLLPGSAFSSFTALLSSWTASSGDPPTQDFVITYAVTGPDAAWYTLSFSATSFSVRRLAIFVTPPTSLQYDITSELYSLTLEQPPKVSLEISLCASKAILMQPATLTFGPGNSTVQFSIIADSATLSIPAPANLPVSWQLGGTSASFYATPDSFTLSLSLANTIIVAGLPSEFSIATATVFEMALPNLNFQFTSVTVTPTASALTFTPAQITFTPTRLRFFVSVAADVLMQVQDASYPDVVTFFLSGPDALRFTAPAPAGVSIDKQAITVAYPSLTTVGSYLNGVISLSQPPTTSLTLSAVLSPGLTLAPSQFTFGPYDTTAYFIIFATTASPVSLEWELSGIAASYYAVPTGITYSDLTFSMDVSTSRQILRDLLGTVYVVPELVELSPDGTSSSNIRVELSDAPLDGLTVTPVLPPGFQSSRILQFAPGQADLSLRLFVNASADTFYSGYFQIPFVTSGPDSNWYQSVSVLSVTIRLGSFYMDLAPTTVGLPSYNEITLTVTPPNGVILIPSATGAIFDPPQLEFNQNTILGKLSITPLVVGNVFVTWSVVGPDAWMFQIPAPMVVVSSPRQFYIAFDELDTLVVGVPYIATAYISYPPPTGLTLTLLAPCLTFYPSSTITFSPSTASKQATYSPSVTCDEAGSLYATLTGPDSEWYTLPFSESISFTVRRRYVIIDGSLEFVSGVTSSPLSINLEVPGDISLQPRAPGCSFDPSEFDFSDTVSSISFTVLCNSAAPSTSSVSTTIEFGVSGTDSDLYEVDNWRIDIFANSIWIPAGPLLLASGVPYTYSISLSNLPSSPITLTPYATSFTFNPPSITFTDSLYATLAVTSTGPSGFTLNVYYNVSGTGSSGVSLSSQFTSFIPFPGTIYHPLEDYELTVGAWSEELTLWVDPPPVSNVTVTAIAAGCNFSPTSMLFTSTKPTGLFTFSCGGPGTPWVRFLLSGTDAIHYAVPIPIQMLVSQRTFNPALQTDVTVFQTNYGFVSLAVPTEHGLTITPIAPGFNFTPSSFVLQASSSDFAFTYTATQLTGSQTSPLTWSLDGPDASLYSVPDPIDLFVFFKEVLVLGDYSAYAQSALKVGAATRVFVASLDYPPESQLIVTPVGAGLMFNPSSLVFDKGVTGVPFTIQASVDGVDLPIYYTLSGWDAPYYFVEPFSSTVTTELIELLLNYDEEVIVGVPSTAAVVSATNFPTSAVALQFSGAGITYTIPAVSFNPTTSTATFKFTTQFVGSGSIVISVSGDGASQFSHTYWRFAVISNPRTFLAPAGVVPGLFARVPSSLLSIAVEQPPPSTIILTPHAPNVAFNPPVLTFEPSTQHVEFTMTCALRAEQNQLFTSFDYEHFVTWEVEGANASWYTPPATLAFYALPRDLRITTPFLQHLYINIPVILFITTTYEPAENLTIVPSGAFDFEPAVLTLLPGSRAASLTVTPLAEGSYDILFTSLGPDAPLYQTLEQVNFVVQKWHFEIPSFEESFQYDTWNAPLVFRPFVIPPNGVTLTLTSPYLDFVPSTLTFSNAVPYANVSLYLKGLGYTRSQEFEVNFWVGGADQQLFYTPDSVTFNWDVDATRDIIISSFPESLIVGIESAPITVAIPNYPVDELVINFYATSTDVVFNPPSIQLSRTSTALTASFTILVAHPSAFVSVSYSLDGSDAIYYSGGSTYSIEIIKRAFVFPDFPELTVGLPSQPLAVSLSNPTIQRVTLSFSSPSILFEPHVLVFTPTQSSVAVILTGGTIGTQVPFSVWIGGEDANLYDVLQQDPLVISSRQWKNTPDSVSVTPGKATTVFFSVYIPPNKYITLTPYASGVSFSPAMANMTSSTSSVSFTVWGQTAGTRATVTTIVGGPDALLYDIPENYQVEISFLTVSITQGLTDDMSTIQVGETNAVVFGVSATPINGIYVTPSAQGLVFNPPTLYFAPGVLYAHTTYTASVPGVTQVTFSLSGPDRLLYQIDPTLSALVKVELLAITAGQVDTLVLGSLSGSTSFISLGGNGRRIAPPLPITVNFAVSPPNAVSIYPLNVTLQAPILSFTVQFQPNIYSSLLVVQPIISGPGALFYDNPSPIMFSSVRRDFIISSFNNYVVDPITAQFTVGVEVGPFGVTARSVPTDVALHLSGPGLEFIPSVLRFTGTYETLYFTIIPTRSMQTYVTFAVGGTDAPLFEVPSTSPLIRITHNFVLPPLPAVIVGRSSSPLTVSVSSQLTSPVILEPTAPCVTFSPPYIIFTPNVSQQTFTFAGTCVNYNLGQNVNPVITQDSHFRYSNPPSVTPVTWQVREAGELNCYQLSVPQLQGTQAANIVPATFKVSFSKLYIGNTQGHVNISVTAPPRSDVVLTLIANNLNFDPPYATFTHATTTQNLAIQVVHSDFKDSNNIPFIVDYIVSGYNWQDFIPPAQTYLGVQQGEAPVVGAICGRNDAGRLSVNFIPLVIVIVSCLL